MNRTLSYNATLGILTLTVEGVETSYGVDVLPHEYGPAVRLIRVWKFGEPNSYTVTLAHQAAACTCPGYKYHHSCRHIDALAALIATGRLD